MVKHHFAAISTDKAKQFDLASPGFASDTGAFWRHTSSAMIRNRWINLILQARHVVPLALSVLPQHSADNASVGEASACSSAAGGSSSSIALAG